MFGEEWPIACLLSVVFALRSFEGRMRGNSYKNVIIVGLHYEAYAL